MTQFSDVLMGISFSDGETPAHCDPRVVHRPGHCEFCDRYARKLQKARIKQGVNFSDEEQDPRLLMCPAIEARGYESVNSWGGNQPSGKGVSDAELSVFERIETAASRMFYGALARRSAR